MRTALLAAAVGGMIAARRRRRPVPAPAQVRLQLQLPVQRAPLLEDDVTLSVTEQHAQDERILALLDRY